MTPLRTRLATIAAALTLAVVAATPALAHTSLVSSDPAEGATVTVAPAEVTLTFAENLLPDAATVSFNDAAGAVVSTSKVPVEGAVVHAPWPSGLVDGAYVIAYRVVADDGHPVIGTINIVLDTGMPASTAVSSSAAVSSSTAASAPATAPAQTTTASSGMGGVALAITGLALLAVVVVVLALVRRRRR